MYLHAFDLQVYKNRAETIQLEICGDDKDDRLAFKI